MKLQTIVVLLVFVAIGYFLAVSTREWTAKKTEETPRESTEAGLPERKQGKQTPDDISQLDRILAVAERLQKFGKWQEAAEKYKEAYESVVLTEAEADRLRRKLDAVNSIILAEDLAAGKKWAEAIVAYEAALDETENKSYVEKAINRTNAQRRIADCYEKGRQFTQEGQWDKARAAFREVASLARQHDVETDALARMKEVDELAKTKGERQEGLLRTLDMCAKSGDDYAALAVCDYVEKTPACAGVRNGIAERKKELTADMEKRAGEFPSLVATGDMEILTLRRKDGSVSEGVPVSKEGSKLVLMVLDGVRFTNRIVVKSRDSAVEKRVLSADEVNEGRSRDLFAEMVKAVGREDYVSALRFAGCLQHQFPKSQVIVNATCQQRTTGATSPRVASTVGRTLDELLSASIERLGTTCVTCAGTGLVKCTACNGTGMRRIKCLMCTGTGKGTCGRCGGTKKVLVKGKMVPCTKCKETGWVACNPCQGVGELTDGCPYCDANHMIKCPDCIGTGREQPKAHEMSTGEPAPKPDSPESKKARMRWLFDICTARSDPHALFAAAWHYERHDDYKPFADLIAARAEEAKAEIAARNKRPAEEPKTAPKEVYDVIKTKDGQSLVGKIVKDDKSTITIAVAQGDKTVNRVILKKSVDSVGKTSDDQGQETSASAGVALANAAHFMEQEKEQQALSTMGKLLYSWPDSNVVTDDQTQKKIIGEASSKVFLVIGGTLKDLAAAAVKRLELTCIDCEGKATFPCDACEGKGTRTVPCKWCRGSKRIYCRNCGGCGQEGDLEHPVTCKTCNGTGWTACTYCQKTGKQVARCDKCNGATEVKCKRCGGDGWMDSFPLNR